MVQDTANLLVPVRVVQRQEPGASLAHVWREALLTFGRHPAPILASAFFGFALSAILAAVLGALYAVDMYTHTGTAIISFGPSRITPIVVEAIVGTVTGAFARGMITVLALRLGTTRAALRAVLSRWWLLLFVVACTGGILFLGNLGLDALLREFRIDLSDISQLSLTIDGMARTILLRTISSFMPDPGAPFTQWITYQRMETSRVSASLIYAGGFSFYRVVTIQEAPVPWLLGGAGLLLITAVDALFRFATASVMRASTATGVRSLWAALQLSGRRFGLVLLHTWIVRIGIFVVNTLFVTAPLVLLQYVMAPLIISSTGSAWPYIVMTMLVSSSLAMVSMVFIAFGIVYDARLYEWLRES